MKDLIGDKFNALLVIEKADRIYNRTAWLCRCNCGNKLVVTGNGLKTGHKKSCGCLNKNKTHNCTNHPLFKTWLEMIRRCHNKKSQGYSNYGKRGIKVCLRWKHKINGIKNFISDMGKKPSSKHSIERRDNNKGYCKSNCYWATIKEQNNNTRNNVVITYKGKTLTASQWSRLTDINVANLYYRVKSGWNAERILNKECSSLNS